DYPDHFASDEDYTNPFAKLCEGDGTPPALREANALRQLACLIDETENEDCTATIVAGDANTNLIAAGGVTANVWTYTAKQTDDETMDLPRDTIERGYAENPENDESPEFWKAGQTVMEVSDRAEIDSFDIIELNLATVEGDDLRVNAGDGAGYGTVAWNATDAPALLAFNKKFAWILPTTDLGAVLTAPSEGAPTTAVWHGQASLLLGTKTFAFDNLELMVNLTDRMISSTTDTTTQGDAPMTTLMTTLELAGRFNEYGLITGTTTVSQTSEAILPLLGDKTNYTGTLTGLAGTDGAVGAFISDGKQTDKDGLETDAATDYAGAFVVSATLCADDPFALRCDQDVFNNARQTLYNDCVADD
ncbi:MAG: hypothetical protein K8953_05365, partial [Proteobacteria bacterium]|nr:hypothetical protein [Pseudomonadota bacterium]